MMGFNMESYTRNQGVFLSWGDSWINFACRSNKIVYEAKSTSYIAFQI